MPAMLKGYKRVIHTIGGIALSNSLAFKVHQPTKIGATVLWWPSVLKEGRNPLTGLAKLLHDSNVLALATNINMSFQNVASDLQPLTAVDKQLSFDWLASCDCTTRFREYCAKDHGILDNEQFM